MVILTIFICNYLYSTFKSKCFTDQNKFLIWSDAFNGNASLNLGSQQNKTWSVIFLVSHNFSIFSETECIKCIEGVDWHLCKCPPDLHLCNSSKPKAKYDLGCFVTNWNWRWNLSGTWATWKLNIFMTVRRIVWHLQLFLPLQPCFKLIGFVNNVNWH